MNYTTRKKNLHQQPTQNRHITYTTYTYTQHQALHVIRFPVPAATVFRFSGPRKQHYRFRARISYLSLFGKGSSIEFSIFLQNTRLISHSRVLSLFGASDWKCACIVSFFRVLEDPAVFLLIFMCRFFGRALYCRGCENFFLW